MNAVAAFKIVADAALINRTALADRVVVLEALLAIAREAAPLSAWSQELTAVLNATREADRAQLKFKELLTS
jgi:hypothetical protein